MKKTSSKKIINAIKGFDLTWKCRDFQFEVGKTYTHDGDVAVCASGFHAVEGYPLEVFDYYPPGSSRYADVKLSGIVSRSHADGSRKLASSIITIGAELTFLELVERVIAWLTKSVASRGLKLSYDKIAPDGAGYQQVTVSTHRLTVPTSSGTQHASVSVHDRCASVSEGRDSAAVSLGDQSVSRGKGIRVASITTGSRGVSVSAGNMSAAISLGFQSASASDGVHSAAVSLGDDGAASSAGNKSVALSAGKFGRAMGADGCALFLVYRDEDWNILHAWAGIVGRDGIKPFVWYSLDENGVPVEVAS